jgi:hypothetical protein
MTISSKARCAERFLVPHSRLMRHKLKALNMKPMLVPTECSCPTTSSSQKQTADTCTATFFTCTEGVLNTAATGLKPCLAAATAAVAAHVTMHAGDAFVLAQILSPDVQPQT